MKVNLFIRIVRVIVVLALAASPIVRAQTQTPEHLGGAISDYTPLNASANPTGPYEMRGKWSLKLKGNSGKADFTAEMNMELSDYWVLTTSADPTNSGARGQHTHHITMTDATVTYDTSVCPANSPATNPTGLVINGPVSITGNGTSAPFESKGPSTMQVCIAGGKEVEFSNLTLVLKGPATGHFGSQTIHGVVRFLHKSDKCDKEDKAAEDKN